MSRFLPRWAIERLFRASPVAILQHGDKEHTMPRPITVEDLYRLQHIEEPQFTPDGRHIAYVRVLPQRVSNDYERTIWLVARDGQTPPLQLTRGGKDNQPRWSPDGQTLAFVRAPLTAAKSQARAATRRKRRQTADSPAACLRGRRRSAPAHQRAQWRLLPVLVARWPAARFPFADHCCRTGR